MHFGVHLLKQGHITADQLADALTVQQDTQPPLGQLAIEEGLLSVRDVFRVLRVQSDFTAERFGQTAVDLGLLNRRDVASLLMTQGDRRRTLEEILIEAGAIDRETCALEREAYRQDHERRGAAGLSAIRRLAIEKPIAPSIQPTADA